MLGLFGGILVLIGALMGSYRFSLLLPTAVLAIPAALVLGLGLRQANSAYMRALSGVRAEERVAKVLARSGVAAVANGVLLGSGDVDHVVLGPCVAAVETKHGRGRITLAADGSLRVNGRPFHRDPVSQAAEAARRVSSRLGLAVAAIVAISDTESPAFQTRGVWVCSIGDLPTILRSFPATLAPERAVSLAGSLPVARSL
jgi:hypothetical protein